MKSYPVDLRDRVVACVLAGEPIRLVGKKFSVSPASVSRWSQRQRERGNSRPDRMGGKVTPILDKERSWLLGRMAEEPDVALRHLQVELAGRGVVVCYGTIWNFVHREDFSFKKKRAAQRAGSA